MHQVNVGSKKQLAVLLSQLKGFIQGKVKLEQYPTDSETAADILWNAMLLGDITEKRIIDAGCGTGILGLGALLLGAAEVTFVDIDAEALETAKSNLSKLESEGYELGTTTFTAKDILKVEGTWDTVLQNPPFGTRSPGADASFLRKAITLGTSTYSFHKTSTEEFIDQCIKDTGAQTTHKFPVELIIRNTYQHHTKKLQRIKVSVWRVLSVKTHK